MWNEAMQTNQNTYKDSGEYHEKPQVQKVIRSTVEHEIVLIQKRSVKFFFYNKYVLLQLPNSQNTSNISFIQIMKESVSIFLHVETTMNKTVS